MSGEVKVAWSCLTPKNLIDTELYAASIAKTWLKSQVESWNKEVFNATKRGGQKDTNNATIPLLVHSGSPLKEFHASFFRIKDMDFKLLEMWKKDEEPPAHMTLATFAAAIYEINKCAVTESNEAAVQCGKYLGVCKSYVDSGPTFRSTYEALPIQAVQYRMEKVEKGAKSRQESGENLKVYQQQVEKMTNLDDFRNVLVTLITAAKCGSSMPGISQQVHTISEALLKFKWEGLKTGTPLGNHV